MRLSTASTRRASDRWKDRASLETVRFYSAVGSLTAALLMFPRQRRLLLALPIAVVGVLNFAFFEFGVLTLLLFFSAKLGCYRLVNSMMRRAQIIR